MSNWGQQSWSEWNTSGGGGSGSGDGWQSRRAEGGWHDHRSSGSDAWWGDQAGDQTGDKAGDRWRSSDQAGDQAGNKDDDRAGDKDDDEAGHDRSWQWKSESWTRRPKQEWLSRKEIWTMHAKKQADERAAQGEAAPSLQAIAKAKFEPKPWYNKNKGGHKLGFSDRAQGEEEATHAHLIWSLIIVHPLGDIATSWWDAIEDGLTSKIR